MFFKKQSAAATWLVVCLGNPGDKYDGTRHNIGFMVADYLGREHNLPIQKSKFKALTNQFTFGETKVLVMKPMTFMNLSGEAVVQAVDYYKIPLERVLVVSDEVAFPVGKLKISGKGSAGGHNGLKNIIQHLGSDQFPRIRVGVGEKPFAEMDMADWVLGKFSKEDSVDEAVKEAAKAVTLVVTLGLDSAMAQCNAKVKGQGLTRQGSPSKKQQGKVTKSEHPPEKSDKENPLPPEGEQGDVGSSSSGGANL